MILSNGEDFNIYGEERISTESDEERLTYISGLNQSVFATITQDKTPEQKDDIMITVSYDDAGNSVDMVNGFGYNGEKADESGNIYLRARYYNPRIGQFVQIDSYRGTQDSISSQQRYTYCLNNQYKYVDCSGNSITGWLVGGLIVYSLVRVISAYMKKPKEEEDEVDVISSPAIDFKKQVDDENKKQEKSEAKIDASSKTSNRSKKNGLNNTKPKKKEPTPCIIDKHVSLSDEYYILSFYIRSNEAGAIIESRCKDKIGFSRFNEKQKKFLNAAIITLLEAKDMAIHAEYNHSVIMYAISSFSGISIDKMLGMEYEGIIPKLSKNISYYVTSGKNEYKLTYIWESTDSEEYGIWKPMYLNKYSSAYKVYNGILYKWAVDLSAMMQVASPLINADLDYHLEYHNQKYVNKNLTWNEFQKNNKGRWSRKDMSRAWKLYKLLYQTM